jgi:CRP/FNR family transcriptional regulator
VSGELRRRLVGRFPLFAELPPATLDELVRGGQEIHAPAGTVLFDERQPCSGFPLVLEGGIRVAKAAPSGRGIVLYRVGPGEGCILSGGCLLGNASYPATGVAESDVALLRIPPALFQKLMMQSEPFRRFVFGMYGDRLSEVMALVEAVAFQRLDARLAQLLIRRGPVVQATHQALADELGSVREIVSRLLRSFEERGWVRLERERVTLLDLKALAAHAQGA